MKIIKNRTSEGGYKLQTELWVSAPIERVFDFFADAFNLNRITPPWLGFEILTPPPIPMQIGTLIDYRLRLHGIHIRWTTEIAAWARPLYFVDRQLRGPYRYWIHEHYFLERNGETCVRDEVRYATPGGPLVHYLLVRNNLKRIFRFRKQRLRQIFSISGTATRLQAGDSADSTPPE